MIKQMKYFQAVVRLQSFTKAADECFISQSAISQQLQALEKDLGVKLMHRERRKFTLTAAGEYFYRKSLVIVSDFEFNIPPAPKEEIRYIPIMRRGQQIFREYYAFWRADTLKEYIESFAAILKGEFPEDAKSAERLNEVEATREREERS